MCVLWSSGHLVRAEKPVPHPDIMGRSGDPESCATNHASPWCRIPQNPSYQTPRKRMKPGKCFGIVVSTSVLWKKTEQSSGCLRNPVRNLRIATTLAGPSLDRLRPPANQGKDQLGCKWQAGLQFERLKNSATRCGAFSQNTVEKVMQTRPNTELLEFPQTTDHTIVLVALCVWRTNGVGWTTTAYVSHEILGLWTRN